MVKIDSITNNIIFSKLDFQTDVAVQRENYRNHANLSGLSEVKEMEMSDFDQILRSRWDTHMEAGHFRYGLDVLETRNVFSNGVEKGESNAFVAQYNPRRATQRRKPEIMTSVANQPFNTEKFNFAKINDSKELIFGLEFEQVGDKEGDKNNDVIINASPIEYGHSLLVPNRIHGQFPQVLSERSVVLAIRLVMLSGLINFKAAFNSLCAYASVNHLHWHLYYMSPEFQLPIETCSAKPLVDDCYEVEDYSAKGFVFQIKSVDDIERVAKKVFSITKLLCDLNIAHNLFITRGTNLDKNIQRNDTTPDKYDVIRVFLWARNTVEGGKDPGAFVIATCELAGHILIYDREEYDSIGWNKIAKAHQEACESTFVEVKPKIIQLLDNLDSPTDKITHKGEL